MGKRSMKAKQEKKSHVVLHSMIKNLKPKVYITDSSNFKNLVQELTGNNQNDCSSSSVQSSHEYSSSTSFPAQTWELVPNDATPTDDHAIMNQENSIHLWLNNDSSSFESCSVMESSPDLSVKETSLIYGLGNSNTYEFDDLESLLAMCSDSGAYDKCYEVIHPQVNVFDPYLITL